MVECPAGEAGGISMRFTIRDLLWLIVVTALVVGWWDGNRRSMYGLPAYKMWGFEIAAGILEEKTGDKMVAERNGVRVSHPDGTHTFYTFEVFNHR